MSASGVLWSLAVAGLSATASLAAPSELVIDDVPGFELTSAPATDLTFDEYAQQEPESVDHLDPESDAAVGLRAAVALWTDARAGASLEVELVLAVDEASATTFVDKTAANAIAIGLAATDPPFGGAWSYSGGLDETWTDVVSWNQGPYAVTMTKLSGGEGDRSDIDAAAVRQAEIILAETGAAVSEDAAVADDAPPPPTGGTEPTEAAADRGTRVIQVVVAIAAVAVVGIALVVIRRRRDATVVGS